MFNSSLTHRKKKKGEEKKKNPCRSRYWRIKLNTRIYTREDDVTNAVSIALKAYSIIAARFRGQIFQEDIGALAAEKHAMNFLSISHVVGKKSGNIYNIDIHCDIPFYHPRFFDHSRMFKSPDVHRLSLKKLVDFSSHLARHQSKTPHFTATHSTATV